MSKRMLVDPDGNCSGNTWNSARNDEDEYDDENTFKSLLEQDEGCPCGYEGALRSTRRGWKCPKCKNIVVPSES